MVATHENNFNDWKTIFVFFFVFFFNQWTTIWRQIKCSLRPLIRGYSVHVTCIAVVFISYEKLWQAKHYACVQCTYECLRFKLHKTIVLSIFARAKHFGRIDKSVNVSITFRLGKIKRNFGNNFCFHCYIGQSIYILYTVHRTQCRYFFYLFFLFIYLLTKT